MYARKEMIAALAMTLCLLPSALSHAEGARKPLDAVDPLEARHREIDAARDLFLDEDLQASQRQLEALLGADLPPEARARVDILMGRIFIERGLGQRALGHLDKVDEALVPAPAYLFWLKARAHTIAGKYAPALELLRAIVLAEPESIILHYARAELADVLYDAGQYDEAGRAYADLLDLYPEFPRQHVAMYRRAQILLRQGDEARGAALMREVWWRFPFKEEGDKARLILDAGRLVGIKIPVDSPARLFERAHQLRKLKHWREATDALNDLLAQLRRGKPDATLENRILMELALTALDMQDYDEALPRLQELDARSADPALNAGLSRDAVLDTLQDCHHRMGDSERAEAILNGRLKGRPASERDRALARFYWEDGRYEDSRRHQERTLRGRARQGWDYAFLLLKTGDARGAERLLVAMRGDPRKRDNIPVDQLDYWIARARQKQGRADDALKAYQGVVDAHPRTWYAHLASSRLKEIKAQRDSKAPLDARSACIHWSGPDKPPEAPNEALFGRPEAMTPYTTPLALQGGARRASALHGDLWPALKAASFLADIVLEWDAQFEMRKAAMEFRELDAAFAKGASPTAARPIALTRTKRWGHFVDNRRTERLGFWGLKPSALSYPVPRAAAGKAALAHRQNQIKARRAALRDDLRVAMMDIGDYHLVRIMRFGQGGWRGEEPGEAPELWSEAYPRAYARLVTHHARKNNVNPYLLWAIMTVESGYNPDTISYADARGLLQVIPKTGNKVAAALGENDFGPYDLMRPDTSIRHGAWYFRQLLDKFHGQEPLAIASYNGGPHNVQRWLKHKSHVPLDEFVEEIPFSQARRYTKRVTLYLGLFLNLYEGAENLYLGQRLNEEARVEPRY